jgi:peptidyl-prolyl cis-trans isomerase SurA
MKYIVIRSRTRLWRRAVAVLLGVGILLSTVHAQEIDEVVLIVDDIAVTQHEYDVLHFIQIQAERFEHVVPDLDSVATESIVDDMLLTAHARRIAPDATVSDAQVEQAVESLAGRNQLSADQLRNQLGLQGVDAKIFESSLRQRLLVQQIIGQRMASSVKVSPAEIEEYIENRPELRSQARKTFRASHIVISLEDGLRRGEIKKRARFAEDIRARLLDGETMAALAEEYETVSASGDKGDLGWKTADDLPELFVKALDKLRVGEVSAVLESSNGFHLLALTDMKSAGSAPQEYLIRHIAKGVQAGADGREQAVYLQNLKFQILAGLDFGAVAKAQSDDSGSAPGGGELGWLQLKEIDPDFAGAIQVLEVGEISDPVRSAYGFHLIQLLQKRDVSGSVTLESQVQQRIFAEKLDEKMQDLLNNLKQSSLVEVVE